jgi:predicted membrane-bound spermidine synthase
VYILQLIVDNGLSSKGDRKMKANYTIRKTTDGRIELARFGDDYRVTLDGNLVFATSNEGDAWKKFEVLVTAAEIAFHMMNNR